MKVSLHAFPDEAAPAERLARALGVEFRQVETHDFPDGESLPTVSGVTPTVLVYRSLDRPNPKLMPLLLACDAWRRAGAQRLVLVAPYLSYLRQDAVFGAGQPLSRDVIGGLLARSFDRLVTVDPHLHRTADLSRCWGLPVSVASAAPVLAAVVGSQPDLCVVGPDVESEAWARALADALGAEYAVFSKRRGGDRDVAVEAAGRPVLAGRPVVIADDIASTGETIVAAARAALDLGASSVDVAVTHALFGPETEARLQACGIGRVVATDSCAARPGGAALADQLACAVRDELD